MSFRVLPEAETEYWDAAHWYDTQQPGLGHEFLDELELAFQEIERDPSRFPELETRPADSSGFRRCRLQRFPYYVVLLVRGQDVLVVAVAHGAREPGYWTGRETGQ